MDQTIIIVVTALTTFLGALLLHKREMSKVNVEMYETLSSQSKDINDRINQELSYLSDKNGQLKSDIEELDVAITRLRESLQLITREYAQMKAEVDELIKISEALIKQIKENGMDPVVTIDEVKARAKKAKRIQEKICSNCLNLSPSNTQEK
jgi:predicted  nucleic acid-binding Zn-ribbon protein